MRTVIWALSVGLLSASPVFAHGGAAHGNAVKENAAEPVVAPEKTMVAPSKPPLLSEFQTYKHESAGEPKLIPIHS